MKVLHVAPSFAVGGREMRAVALMGMMPPGTVTQVVALDGRTDSLSRLEPGVAVEVLEGAPGKGGRPRQRMRAIRQFLKDADPDLLLTYNWGSFDWLLAAKRLGLRTVVHHEDGFGPEEAVRLLRRRIWLRRWVFPTCAAIAVPSRTLYEIGRTRWKQPPERLLYLPNGVDVSRFSPVQRAAGRDLVFGCVGRLRPEKNPLHAVEAFGRAACRDTARLRIVGEGSELAACQAAARRLGVVDRVDFVGGVEDTAPEYREMDVYLVPSRTEQMPLVLLEAMATGLPVIGTDVGDVRAMVAEPNRPWIDRALRDPGALAQRMDAMAADADLRSTLGAANRLKAEAEFEIGACYGAYVSLYEQIARGVESRQASE